MTQRKKTTQNTEPQIKYKTKKEFILEVIKKKSKEKFLSENQKKYYNLLKTLNNLDESGIQIELTSEPEIGRFFEVVVKWRNKESIMNLIYIYQTNKVRILDEFDKQLEECDLEELGENLFLIMSEM